MSKCTGCGAKLQNEFPNDIGYSNNIESSLCERCFRIVNYNEYKTVIKNNDEIVNILHNIYKTKSLVLLVVDLLNINNIEKILKYISNDFIVILSKRDLLPKSVNDEKLIDYVKKLIPTAKEYIIISSKKNYNFDTLLEKIKSYQTNKDVYVVGYTNSGKSTMINKLIYNYSSNNSNITTSLLPNTTIDLIKINLDDNMVLIDTPGIIDSGNIINYLNKNDIKKLFPKKEIRPITYQLKQNDILIINDFFRLDSITKSNITFFISNQFDIKRFYNTERLKNLQSINLNVKNGEDIVITGLGFIKVTKDSVFKIYLLKDVSLYTRKSLI
ncbi:MAG: 50S ribosome-binding GTPase [Clostridium sp.]|nr:50S ribosome-binding GTPase [Clostridium sp.]MCM1444250.1 50S ribosome-binding GTPase [Candidatus Amulumruptor caecigallinarius]